MSPGAFSKTCPVLASARLGAMVASEAVGFSCLPQALCFFYLLEAAANSVSAITAPRLFARNHEVGDKIPNMRYRNVSAAEQLPLPSH